MHCSETIPVKIRFTPTARKHFLKNLEYIRQDYPAAARKFRRKAETLPRRLEEFPESNRSSSEFPELPHREVIGRPCRFFYRVAARRIWIVAVWHDAEPPEGPCR